MFRYNNNYHFSGRGRNNRYYPPTAPSKNSNAPFLDAEDEVVSNGIYRRRPEVMICFGTDVSIVKHWITEYSPDAYWKQSNMDVWDGYDGISDIVLTVLLPYSEFISLIEQHPFQVVTSTGSVWINPKRVFISLTSMPSDWYPAISLSEQQSFLRIVSSSALGVYYDFDQYGAVPVEVDFVLD